MVGIDDPIKDEVPDFIRYLKKAECHVIICTGDSLEATKNFAYEIGLIDDKSDLNTECIKGEALMIQLNKF